MCGYFFWNQNPHVIGFVQRWVPIPFLSQKYIPSLYVACADQSHRELHSIGMDDTHTDLFRRCCSWDTPLQCSQFAKMTLYPSIKLLSLDAVSSLAPFGVCTWPLSERVCQFVIITWLVERETSYTSLSL